ncbi:unnamed protein product [Phytophthora fragariaefolia]|uniref:Unnamed protein product n=1 Tax=Phytophthora fragariaefolia TaxID=1490495 RepID=A0A9W6Y7B7_9STRA|nr:unnamed protein product [Phytophthora fragariaefolia]
MVNMTTSQLSFANGTVQSAVVCGSVLLRVCNQVIGELEDKLLENVMYIANAQVNIISLGYMQMEGRFKLVCSDDQRTAWLSKPGTYLRFDMRDNIYRLRVEHVAGVMVNAVRTKTTDSKNTMSLLHQRFGHLNIPAAKAMTSKQKIGVKINAKDLNFYDCVACTAGKAKRIHHARRSLRELQPLSIVMMDVCSMDEPTAYCEGSYDVSLRCGRGHTLQVGVLDGGKMICNLLPDQADE